MSDERYKPGNRKISKITLHSALLSYIGHLKQEGFSVTPMSSMSADKDNIQVVLTEIRTERDGQPGPSLVYKRSENSDGSILEKLTRVNRSVIIDPSAAVDNAEDYPLRIVVSTSADEPLYDERLLDVRISQIDGIYRGDLDDKLREYLTTTEAIETLEDMSIDVVEVPEENEEALPELPLEICEPIAASEYELDESVDRYLQGDEQKSEKSLEESIEDDEGIGLEISTMLQDEAEPEELDWEVVSDGVTRTRLECIGNYENPRTGESYDRTKIDNALMSVMTSCHDDLASTIYEHFFVVVPKKGLAYDLGSRALFIEHEKRPATRGAYEKEELKERLKVSLTGAKIDPEQRDAVTRAIKSSAENAPKYLSMARYCTRNQGRIQVYEAEDLTAQTLLNNILPKQGTIAIYSPDYGFVKELISLTMKERGALRFEQVANLLEMSLTLEGRTLQFVGFGPRNVFEQYFSTDENPAELETLLLGDAIIGAMVREEERTSGFSAPTTGDVELPEGLRPSDSVDARWEEPVADHVPGLEVPEEVVFTEPINAKKESQVVVKKEKPEPEKVVSLDAYRKAVNGDK